MSSSSLRKVGPTVGERGTSRAELRELVEALESFAFQRERVLMKLDLRAAAQARHIARRLGSIAPFVRLGLDDELREAASLELAAVMAQARVCLGRPPVANGDRPLGAEEPTALEADPASSIRARRDERRDPEADDEAACRQWKSLLAR